MEIEGRCFYLETQHLPFLKAKANCARNKFSTGGRLFEPKTLAENDKICDTLGNLLGNIFFILKFANNAVDKGSDRVNS